MSLFVTSMTTNFLQNGAGNFSIRSVSFVDVVGRVDRFGFSSITADFTEHLEICFAFSLAFPLTFDINRVDLRLIALYYLV
jgi:hypothetical protein